MSLREEPSIKYRRKLICIAILLTIIASQFATASSLLAADRGKTAESQKKQGSKEKQGKKEEHKTAKTKNGRAKFAKKSRAIIIYTGKENPRSRGYQAAENIKFYLKHFRVEGDSVAARKYTKNLFGSYKWVFYVGEGKERVRRPLARDLRNTNKKVFWINNNIRQLGGGFFRRHGFKVAARKKRGRLLSYKERFLPMRKGRVNQVKILNTKKNTAYSWIFVSKTKKKPHIIKSRNFWYMADNPFPYKRGDENYLVFSDILHNLIEDHQEERRAVIRIDQINPNTSPQKLHIMVNFLYLNRLPFAMSVTPVYKKSAKAKPIRLHEKPELLGVIKEARRKGGVVVLNGYTHQAGKETGREAEFGIRKKRSPRAIEARADRRLKAAMAEMKKSGLKPKIWHTPFYRASPLESKVFRKYFKYAFEPGGGPAPPYIVGDNPSGQRFVPDNLGMDPGKGAPDRQRVKEKAWRMHVVRDAYAGFSVTPNAFLDDMTEMIREIQTMNYAFVSPHKVVDLKFRKSDTPFYVDRMIYEVSVRTSLMMENMGMALLPFIFFGYYLIIFGLSRRFRPRPKKANPNLFFVFIVPALNEGKVIRKTLERLVSLEQDNYMVLAMNDNSDDDTEAEIKKVQSDKITLFTVRPPHCQKGKGNVLNIAYRYLIHESGLPQKYGPDNLVIAIVDSDGGVDPDILPSVAPYFDEKDSAAVQTAVRIENCDRNILTKWQDFEFRVFTFIFQSAREQLGSVGLGGNGQFIRLSSLDDFGDSPWTSCLTEDLDIGIRLILSNKRNHFCSTSYVSQQAIPKFWPLVRQRTRWFQGHVQCWRHLGPIAIKRMPLLAKVDITYYLLSISLALLVVPANFMAALQAGYLSANPFLFQVIRASFGGSIFAYWYFIFYGAMPIFSYSYWKTKDQSLPKAVFYSHLFLFISLVWLIAGYLAIFRIFRRTKQWSKTDRYLDPLEEETESV